MTADEFRRIALGMAGTIERSHMQHPDFRANGNTARTKSKRTGQRSE